MPGIVNDEPDVDDVNDEHDVNDEYIVNDEHEVASISANNDCSQIWIPRPHLNGTRGVLEIVEFQPDWMLKKKEFPFLEAEVKLIHMVGDVVIYVTTESPNIVTLWNRKTHKIKQFTSGSQNVKAIKANGNYVTFIQDTWIVIFKVKPSGMIGEAYMQVDHDTTLRPSAVAMASDSPVIAMPVPGCMTSKDVRVISLRSTKKISSFSAHNSEIVCVALNSTATKLATTSVNGTVVKVFNKFGLLLHEFRRGMTPDADIKVIHFSHDSNWIACSNKNRTIHVFKLDEPRITEKPVAPPSTWASYLTAPASAVTSYSKGLLRAGVSYVASMHYAFATLHIKVAGQELLGFMPPHGDSIGFVLADRQSHMLWTYKFDAYQGGECKLHDSLVVGGFGSMYDPLTYQYHPVIGEDDNLTRS